MQLFGQLIIVLGCGTKDAGHAADSEDQLLGHAGEQFKSCVFLGKEAELH
ncbi:hypothetical protein GCM10027404_25010 [Arthrobacter tumbae]